MRIISAYGRGHILGKLNTRGEKVCLPFGPFATFRHGDPPQHIVRVEREPQTFRSADLIRLVHEFKRKRPVLQPSTVVFLADFLQR